MGHGALSRTIASRQGSNGRRRAEAGRGRHLSKGKGIPVSLVLGRAHELSKGAV